MRRAGVLLVAVLILMGAACSAGAISPHGVAAVRRVDGSHLAFTSRPLEPQEGQPNRPGGSATWHSMVGCSCGSPTVVRQDGSGYRVLEEGAVTNPPTWSPDGRHLAYGSHGSVRIFDLETRRVTAVRPEEFGLHRKYLSAPSWAPGRPSRPGPPPSGPGAVSGWHWRSAVRSSSAIPWGWWWSTAGGRGPRRL
jgi:hypothetical protein